MRPEPPRPVTATVVIVGAGFSGTLTAVHLLRGGAPALKVVLIERRARFGRGLAYHTWDDNLLLNVPAGNMSAFGDRPADFLDYCRDIDPAFNAGSFVPRRIYGEYLDRTLAAAERAGSSPFERRAGEAVAVRRAADSGRFTVTLADGATLDADQVVLALGHFPPAAPLPSVASWAARPGIYLPDPWDSAALDRTDPTRPVAILGAGHTAVDVLFSLTRQQIARPVLLISRRGLAPRPHRVAPGAPSPPRALPAYLEGLAPRLRTYLEAIRGQAAGHAAAGGDWRDVLNALRPYTPELWQRLPVAERRRFLRHVLPYWDAHRHRLAPAAYLRLEALRRAGGLRVVAGRLRALRALDDGAELLIESRRDGVPERLTVGAIVNCTGPSYDLAAITLPLVAQLREEGLCRPDALGVGLDLDARYQLLDRAGAGVPGLHYLGPMLKARYWEATAVPELRGHAARLAAALLERRDSRRVKAP